MMQRNTVERLKRQLAAKATNQKARISPDMAWLWAAFVRLSNARSYNMAGPNPITFSEIMAFVHLTGTLLEPWHVEAIIAADEAWRTKINSGPEHPALTPAAVDAAL